MTGSVIALTPGGRKLALQIGNAFGYTVWLPQALRQPGDHARPFTSLRETFRQCFCEQEALVLIMACGIAVRMLAPLAQDKQSDPAVVVMDEAGRFAVSLLSGHWGGANTLSKQLAELTGGTPVITTATDVSGLCAVDVFSREIGAKPEPFSLVKVFNAAMLRGEQIAVFTERPYSRLQRYTGLTFFPLARLQQTAARFAHRAVLTNRARCTGTREGDLYLRPPNLYVGVGCRRGVPASRILAAITKALESHNLAPGSVVSMASIDHKFDEAGLLKAAEVLRVPLTFYSAGDIMALRAPYQVSSFVQQTMGVGAVCEPTAILAARGGRLVVRKQKMDGVTVAVAEAEYPWSALVPEGKKH